MCDLFKCGFIRANILEGHKKFHSSDVDSKYNYFLTQFQPHISLIDKKHFTRKSKELVQFLRKKHWHGEDRKVYIDFFSKTKWDTFGNIEKSSHSLNNCESCSELTILTNAKLTFPSSHEKKTTN